MRNELGRSSAATTIQPPKLGLGTVQFGMDYGITNHAGKVSTTQACRILERASAYGIDLLDTAAAYGNAEEVIGHCLHCRHDSDSLAKQFCIVTKSPVNLRSLVTEDLPAFLRTAIMQSCRKLGTRHLYGYLVHHVEDLLSPAGEIIWETLQQLQTEGIIEKIGFSAYEACEIDAALERFTPDIVQLPFNVVDRRLVDAGTLPALRQANVEVHARSLFLQGILLQPAEQLTGFFSPLSKIVKLLDDVFQEAGLSRLAGLLATVWQTGLVDRLIVGVTSLHEMDEILHAAAEAASLSSLAVVDMPRITDERILNPSLWPPKVKESS